MMDCANDHPALTDKTTGVICDGGMVVSGAAGSFDVEA